MKLHFINLFDQLFKKLLDIKDLLNILVVTNYLFKNYMVSQFKTT